MTFALFSLKIDYFGTLIQNFNVATSYKQNEISTIGKVIKNEQNNVEFILFVACGQGEFSCFMSQSYAMYVSNDKNSPFTINNGSL